MIYYTAMVLVRSCLHLSVSLVPGSPPPSTLMTFELHTIFSCGRVQRSSMPLIVHSIQCTIRGSLCTTYIHTYIHIYEHTYIPTYIHTYIRTHTYIHTYIYTYMYIHIYIHTCTYMYMWLYTVSWLYMLIASEESSRLYYVLSILSVVYIL